MGSAQWNATLADAPDVAHQVALRYADGVLRLVNVAVGQSILDASVAAGVPLLHQCRSGSCGSCIARLCEGRAGQRAGGRSVLLADEHKAGMRLLCQTEPESDCVFDLAYDSHAGVERPRKAHAFVNGIEQIASDVVRLRLELAADHWVTFKPGQYLQLKVPGTDAIRSYSPASTPSALPSLEFLIRLLPGGVMSEWLIQTARVDDVIELEGGFGAFFLRDDVRAPHIFVAGGTGLAPILSMIDTMRTGSGRRQPAILSFGCASPATLFGLDEINLRKGWMPNLEVRVSVDRGATGDLRSGTPVDALSAADVQGADAIAYLCGPPPMIEAARSRLQQIGVRPENIFSEQFLASNQGDGE